MNKVKLKKRNAIDIIYLFLCGFIVFSPLSSFLSLTLLKLPIAIPEFFFIPFYFRLRKIFDLSINKKTFAIGVYILLFLFALGLLVGIYPLISLLSTFRGYIYLIIVFSIFKNKYIPDIKYIVYIALGSTVGWAVLGIISFDKIAILASSYETIVIYGSMITLSLLISIPIIYNVKTIKYFAFGITLIISFTAGLRRQILIAALAYLLSVFMQFKFSLKRTFTTLVTLLIIISTVVILYPIGDSYLKEISPIQHQRIFGKTEQFISGDLGSSDQTRIKSIVSLAENIDEYIFPRGLVSKRTSVDENTGIFNDLPMVELLHTLGLFIALYLIFVFLKKTSFHIKNYRKFNNRESAVCIVMSGVITTLMFLEGSFLNYEYITPMTGFILARIMSDENLIA